MNRTAGIVGIGIATMDIYYQKKIMHPGGNEYNIAYNSKILGANSGFMGIFADDKVGFILEQTLHDIGVDTSHSHHEHGSSGYALVTIKDGDRHFLDWNKHGVTDLYPFEFSCEEIAYIKSFDVACISWGARVNKEKIKKLSKAGITICYDFYDNFNDDDIQLISPFIKYGFFSCSHLTENETREVLSKCVKLGCCIAIGTRGSDATIAFDGKKYYRQDTCKVQPIDTMGAGDSYIASFLVNYLSTDFSNNEVNKISLSLKKAAEFASTIILKDGALGIGYEVDINSLSKIININQ